jgi:hypothetical protein
MALREITRYALDVAYAPEDVIKTLVDFSDRRPLVWRETSHPKVYHLHGLAATGADVTEGVPISWSREQYDWSEPGLVRLRQIDSNMARPGGTITYRITPTPGGCHIACDRGRTFIGLRGHLLGGLMVVFGARILRAQLRTGLDRALGGGP